VGALGEATGLVLRSDGAPALPLSESCRAGAHLSAEVERLVVPCLYSDGTS